MVYWLLVNVVIVSAAVFALYKVTALYNAIPLTSLQFTVDELGTI